MKLAIFGATGQVATELRRRMPHDVDAVVIGRDKADFSDPGSPSAAMAGLRVDAVINAAAYTAVDRAESERELAFCVNAEAVSLLAGTLAVTKTPLIHISTDYVFDGSGDKPWKPGDPTQPLSVYAESKLAGEDAVRGSTVRHCILRTSWVFSAHGNNFVKSMLRLGKERKRLSVVSDQIGGPTPAAEIADALFAIARELRSGHEGGTYHFAGAPDTSWAGFAREIFRQADIDCEIEDIPTQSYPTPARRPLNSRLDCGTLRQDFGIDRPDWHVGLREVLREIA